MASFSQMTQEWANFFSALAQVSGGLVGLVFVALTFNSKALGVNGDPLLGALARQTFADFLILLLVSLLMLMPHLDPNNVGLILLLFCGVDMARIAQNLLRLRTQLRGPSTNWGILQRFVLSGVAHLMLMVVGLELIRGEINAEVGDLLFGGIVMLLLSGCRSAWLLVLQEVR